MNTRVIKNALLGVLLFAGLQLASAFDGLVIAHESAPITRISKDELKNIFTGKTKYWEGGEAIVIIYVDKVADEVLQSACGMNSSAFKTFWQRLAFSGRATPPKKADDVAGAIALVKSTKGAIAVVPGNAAADGARQITVD